MIHIDKAAEAVAYCRISFFKVSHNRGIPQRKEAVRAGMSRRRRGIMSDEFKTELAKDLGIYDTVQRDGWGGITTKDAGNMVKRAIQIAEQSAAGRTKR